MYAGRRHGDLPDLNSPQAGQGPLEATRRAAACNGKNHTVNLHRISLYIRRRSKWYTCHETPRHRCSRPRAPAAHTPRSPSLPCGKHFENTFARGCRERRPMPPRRWSVAGGVRHVYIPAPTSLYLAPSCRATSLYLAPTCRASTSDIPPDVDSIPLPCAHAGINIPMRYVNLL